MLRSIVLGCPSLFSTHHLFEEVFAVMGRGTQSNKDHQALSDLHATLRMPVFTDSHAVTVQWKAYQVSAVLLHRLRGTIRLCCATKMSRVSSQMMLSRLRCSPLHPCSSTVTERTFYFALPRWSCDPMVKRLCELCAQLFVAAHMSGGHECCAPMRCQNLWLCLV